MANRIVNSLFVADAISVTDKWVLTQNSIELVYSRVGSLASFVSSFTDVLGVASGWAGNVPQRLTDLELAVVQDAGSIGYLNAQRIVHSTWISSLNTKFDNNVGSLQNLSNVVSTNLNDNVGSLSNRINVASTNLNNNVGSLQNLSNIASIWVASIAGTYATSASLNNNVGSINNRINVASTNLNNNVGSLQNLSNVASIWVNSIGGSYATSAALNNNVGSLQNLSNVVSTNLNDNVGSLSNRINVASTNLNTTSTNLMSYINGHTTSISDLQTLTGVLSSNIIVDSIWINSIAANRVFVTSFNSQNNIDSTWISSIGTALATTSTNLNDNVGSLSNRINVASTNLNNNVGSINNRINVASSNITLKQNSAQILYELETVARADQRMIYMTDPNSMGSFDTTSYGRAFLNTLGAADVMGKMGLVSNYTLADNAAVNIDLGAACTNVWIKIAATDFGARGIYAEFYGRAFTSTNSILPVGTPQGQWPVTGNAYNTYVGTLTGATGSDSSFNIAISSAQIWVENRMGASRTFMVFVVANSLVGPLA